MKKIFFFFSFCLVSILSDSQPVTTDPKKQPVKNNSANPVATYNKEVTTDRLTPLCFGKVASDGTLLNGSRNVTIDRGLNGGVKGTGDYYIRCAGIRKHSIVMVNSSHYSNEVRFRADSNYCRVTMSNDVKDGDYEFHFVIYDPGQ